MEQLYFSLDWIWNSNLEQTYQWCLLLLPFWHTLRFLINCFTCLLIWWKNFNPARWFLCNESKIHFYSKRGGLCHPFCLLKPPCLFRDLRVDRFFLKSYLYKWQAKRTSDKVMSIRRQRSSPGQKQTNSSAYDGAHIFEN